MENEQIVLNKSFALEELFELVRKPSIWKGLNERHHIGTYCRAISELLTPADRSDDAERHEYLRYYTQI